VVCATHTARQDVWNKTQSRVVLFSRAVSIIPCSLASGMLRSTGIKAKAQDTRASEGEKNATENMFPLQTSLDACQFSSDGQIGRIGHQPMTEALSLDTPHSSTDTAQPMNAAPGTSTEVRSRCASALAVQLPLLRRSGFHVLVVPILLP